MNDDINIQIKSTVLEGFGKRKAMFMPMVCVSSFMLVGYAALDTEAPEILTDTLELEINQDIDPSMIVAVDNQDDRSAITITVRQDGFDKTTEGEYVVYVKATDSFMNESEEKAITVVTKDKQKPVVTLNSGEGYTAEANILKLRYNSNGDIRNYITAMDDNVNSGHNGDLTEFVNQHGGLMDTSTLGSQFVTIDVTDNAGNRTDTAIAVHIIDDIAPEFELKGNGNAKINYGSTFDLTDFAKAIDEYEGNLTDKIKVEGQAPNTKVMGASSTLTLTVEDSSGNKKTAKLTLTVADTEAPTISFKKNNFVIAQNSGTINVADYVTVKDNYDTDINSRVTYSEATIDTSKTGEKSVTVSATDKAGNTATRSFNVTVYDPNTYFGNRVVQIAKTKVGCPYVWGAEGPNAFDCSGFTQWVYRQAGMSIPRTVTTQYYAKNQIYINSISDLQPGDLMYFSTYSYRSHVGIYIGNGEMIHAGSSNTGVCRVSINSYWRSAFICGGRFY